MEQASGATRPVNLPSARHQCGGWHWPARVSPPLMRWLAADQPGSAVCLGVEAEYSKMYALSEETIEVSDAVARKGGRGSKLKEVIAKRMRF
ncbi:hypothetical protein E2562_010307 [Oryza meyeriana var. granulata]|uniref:Uncharacterized protein n=1 Tax=Oryza meyeriana var. granulata TaxID=110450 RepID=A0A6G1F658_9ORYZ|nr:hypothetical protein E2562_010307 [Oryza meyeriana var. granulata]